MRQGLGPQALGQVTDVPPRIENQDKLDQYYPTRCRLINLTLELLLDVMKNSIDTPSFYLDKHAVLLMDVVQMMKGLRDRSGHPYAFSSSILWGNQLRDIFEKGLAQIDDFTPVSKIVPV